MKNLFILSILTISLFSCNKEEKGLSYYQFVEGVNNKPVKDTTYYFDTKANKQYKFAVQSVTSGEAGEGFIIWGLAPSNFTTEDVPITLKYMHAKKIKDRKLTIHPFDIYYTNVVVSPEKITFDGGEIYKVK